MCVCVCACVCVCVCVRVLGGASLVCVIPVANLHVSGYTSPPPIISDSLPSPLLSHRWCHWLKTSSRDWTGTMTRASVRRSSSLTTPRRWDTCTPRTRYCTDSTCTCGPLYKMFIPCMFYCTGSFIFLFPIKSTSFLSVFISMSHDCHMIHVTFPSLCLLLLNL